MNLPIIIAGLAGAFLLLNNKKPKTTSKPKENKQDQINLPDNNQNDQDKINLPDEDKNKIDLPDSPTYPNLTIGRMGLINQYLDSPQLQIDPAITPDIYMDMVDHNLLDYTKWYAANPNGLYQDWLTTMMYWQIALREGKWDIGTNELPLLFECAKGYQLAELDQQNPTYKLVTFAETPEQCNKRLAKGKALWLDINNYIHDMIKVCPDGAYCGPI